MAPSLIRLGSALLMSTFITTAAIAAPNFADSIARPLRYRPDGDSFVVENGKETFNRPLYGLNTAFRVDAGDRPELSLYLPGRGGNLRIGIKTTTGAKWLIDADQIVTRYGNGLMRYEIRDALLPDGRIDLTVAAMHATEGVVVRAELLDTESPCELVWAYGGANGVRGGRDGDIGTERIPISQYFQLRPEQCAGSTFDIAAPGFLMHSKSAEIVGIVPEGATCAVADAQKWASVDELLASAAKPTETPVVTGRVQLVPRQARHVALQRLPMPAAQDAAAKPPADYSVSSIPGETRNSLAYLLPAYTSGELARVYDDARQHGLQLARQITVETPDPFINAAVPALCVAADGVWDTRTKAYMHGAVAWRTRLLGWRGGYTGDALGQHDRTRAHLMNWLPKQNTEPVPPDQVGEPARVPQDMSVRLARNEPVLHSNGDLSRSHYDMNLPAIDILFRHLLWTGDLAFARDVWPVIERHLAWERRLFRRPFGPDKLPLYEAYCCIWASDDLQYHGGGVTHSSAYNYYHNKMAARVARLIDKDPALYEREAELILKAMRRELWLGDRGWFAEWKDLLGLQLAHPNAAVWTFYHAIDSEVSDPREAWQMTRFIDTQIPRFPIKGEGVPAGDWHTVSTSSWMPYAWSTNNVVMGEAAHTALSYWQAGRRDQAFRLYKGLILNSMYQGLCPGNVGMCTPFDMARGETQRDFSDGVGTTSRALIEGLFGIRPDALAGELTVQPGLPAEWNQAKLSHPDFSFAFDRQEARERYVIESRFARPMGLRLVVPALRDAVANVTVNGQPAKWRVIEGAVGTPRVEIRADAAAAYDVAITWNGDAPAPPPAEVAGEGRAEVRAAFGNANVLEVHDPQGVLRDATTERNTLRAVASGTPGHRTAFAKVRQGEMTWWSPVAINVQDKSKDNYPMSDWTRPLAIRGKLETLDLSSLFNDRVTQIFKNEYLSPRSPYCSLAIPLQGIGSWPHWDPSKDRHATANIDDSGLRAAADRAGGRLVLPQGVEFRTPGTGDAKNIAFTSQWDNYPREVTVPLSGRANHVYLLMAGSTNSMQSRFDNGEVIVTYADGSSERLPLENPTTWWPIDQDYKIDDFAFRRPQPIPLRVDLKTGEARALDIATFKGQGGKIDGGAATVLDVRLRPEKELKSLVVRTLANEVVIGLMGATLVRPDNTD